MQKNPKAPHQAIIEVNAKIMERLPNGQVTGITVDKINRLLTVFGKDFDDCQQKVEAAMDTIKKVVNNE